MSDEVKSRDELDGEAQARLAQLPSSLTPADRLKIPPQPMPSQAPEVRRRNTAEVAQGYTEAQAVLEAQRCLQCKNQPCTTGCPVELPIRDFVGRIARRDFQGAIDLIKTKSLLPAVCGRVCPQENQCQKYCTVGKSLKDVAKAVEALADAEFVTGQVLGVSGGYVI